MQRLCQGHAILVAAFRLGLMHTCLIVPLTPNSAWLYARSASTEKWTWWYYALLWMTVGWDTAQLTLHQAPTSKLEKCVTILVEVCLIITIPLKPLPAWSHAAFVSAACGTWRYVQSWFPPPWDCGTWKWVVARVLSTGWKMVQGLLMCRYTLDCTKQH